MARTERRVVNCIIAVEIEIAWMQGLKIEVIDKMKLKTMLLMLMRRQKTADVLRAFIHSKSSSLLDSGYSFIHRSKLIRQ
jgi:hypothetical protein